LKKQATPRKKSEVSVQNGTFINSSENESSFNLPSKEIPKRQFDFEE
jgi:hypothetical protein